MPWEGVEETYSRPAGNRSVSATPEAASGPLFLAVTVKVTSWPSLSVAADAFSGSARHTRYWRDWSSDVCSSDLTGSFSVSAVLVAVLVRVPVLVALAVTLKIGRASCRDGASVQVPVTFS